MSSSTPIASNALTLSCTASTVLGVLLMIISAIGPSHA